MCTVCICTLLYCTHILTVCTLYIMCIHNCTYGTPCMYIGVCTVHPVHTLGYVCTVCMVHSVCITCTRDNALRAELTMLSSFNNTGTESEHAHVHSNALTLVAEDSLPPITTLAFAYTTPTYVHTHTVGNQCDGNTSCTAYHCVCAHVHTWGMIGSYFTYICTSVIRQFTTPAPMYIHTV